MTFTRPVNLTLYEPTNHNCKLFDEPSHAPIKCASCRQPFKPCCMWLVVEIRNSKQVNFHFCESCVPAMSIDRALTPTPNSDSVAATHND